MSKLSGAAEQYEKFCQLLREEGVDPSEVRARLELFARHDEEGKFPGWKDPQPRLGEAAEPGVYVEEAKPAETSPRLTEDEWWYVATLLLAIRVSGGGWTKVGYEAGAEYGQINLKADVNDIANLLDQTEWETNEAQPSELHRLWAVEFPLQWWAFREDGPFSENYVRRTFWFLSLHETVEENRSERQQHRLKNFRAGRRARPSRQKTAFIFGA